MVSPSRPIDKWEASLTNHGCDPHRDGDKITAYCPVCQAPESGRREKGRKLTATGKDDGKVVFGCYPCGDSRDAKDSILAALALRWPDCFDGPGGERAATGPRDRRGEPGLTLTVEYATRFLKADAEKYRAFASRRPGLIEAEARRMNLLPETLRALGVGIASSPDKRGYRYHTVWPEQSLVLFEGAPAPVWGEAALIDRFPDAEIDPKTGRKKDGKFARKGDKRGLLIPSGVTERAREQRLWVVTEGHSDTAKAWEAGFAPVGLPSKEGRNAKALLFKRLREDALPGEVVVLFAHNDADGGGVAAFRLLGDYLADLLPDNPVKLVRAPEGHKDLRSVADSLCPNVSRSGDLSRVYTRVRGLIEAAQPLEGEPEDPFDVAIRGLGPCVDSRSGGRPEMSHLPSSTLGEEGKCDIGGDSHGGLPFEFGTAADLVRAFGQARYCSRGPIHDFDDLDDPSKEHAAKLACKNARCPACWGRWKTRIAVAIGDAIDDRPGAVWHVQTGNFDAKQSAALKRQVERKEGKFVRVDDKITGECLLLSTVELPNSTPSSDPRETWQAAVSKLAALHPPQKKGQRPVNASEGLLPPSGGEYLSRAGRGRLREIDRQLKTVNADLQPVGLSKPDAGSILSDPPRDLTADEVAQLKEKAGLHEEHRALLGKKAPTMRDIATYDTRDWAEVRRRHEALLGLEGGVEVDPWREPEKGGVLNGLTRTYGDSVPPLKRWQARVRLTGKPVPMPGEGGAHPASDRRSAGGDPEQRPSSKPDVDLADSL